MTEQFEKERKQEGVREAKTHINMIVVQYSMQVFICEPDHDQMCALCFRYFEYGDGGGVMLA